MEPHPQVATPESTSCPIDVKETSSVPTLVETRKTLFSFNIYKDNVVRLKFPECIIETDLDLLNRVFLGLLLDEKDNVLILQSKDVCFTGFPFLLLVLSRYWRVSWTYLISLSLYQEHGIQEKVCQHVLENKETNHKFPEPSSMREKLPDPKKAYQMLWEWLRFLLDDADQFLFLCEPIAVVFQDFVFCCNLSMEDKLERLLLLITFIFNTNRQLYLQKETQPLQDLCFLLYQAAHNSFHQQNSDSYVRSCLNFIIGAPQSFSSKLWEAFVNKLPDLFLRKVNTIKKSEWAEMIQLLCAERDVTPSYPRKHPVEMYQDEQGELKQCYYPMFSFHYRKVVTVRPPAISSSSHKRKSRSRSFSSGWQRKSPGRKRSRRRS